VAGAGLEARHVLQTSGMADPAPGLPLSVPIGQAADPAAIQSAASLPLSLVVDGGQAPAAGVGQGFGAGSSGLPSGPIASAWWFTYSEPKPSVWPTDVQNIVNLIVIGVADSASAGTGSISFAGGGMSKAEVQAFTSRGVQVILGIGGSSNNGKIKLLSDTDVQQMFDSITSIRNALGITGIDYDMESEGDWSPTYMAKLSAKLKDTYGESFVIGLTMGLYGSLGSQWLAAAQAHNGRYDYAAPMLYDFPEAGDSRLTQVTKDKISYMQSGGIPVSKIIVGFMCRVTGESYPNASPVSVADAAYRAAKAQYPELRGAFIWESAREARDSGGAWPFTRSTLRAARGL